MRRCLLDILAQRVLPTLSLVGGRGEHAGGQIIESCSIVFLTSAIILRGEVDGIRFRKVSRMYIQNALGYWCSECVEVELVWLVTDTVGLHWADG